MSTGNRYPTAYQYGISFNVVSVTETDMTKTKAKSKRRYATQSGNGLTPLESARL